MDFVKELSSTQVAGIPILTILLAYLAFKTTKKVIKFIVIITIMALLVVWYKSGYMNFDVLKAMIIDMSKQKYRTPLFIM